ncbi:hypothetical protein [Loigolactobacillus binensis]|uniref:Uncharacterized protein n=1 Tax=Loigolactobacillus binensis TaxID=2559922 RepID=A0ABW3EEZ5_9LACO|nr:hypothetical protein [Loigolactobacillus binensis]
MKPSRKQILIINLVNNIPLAVVISTVAPVIANMKLDLVNWLTNVFLAFLFACLVSFVFPIQKIAVQLPRHLHIQNPKGGLGRLVANVPLSFLYVFVIGFVLNLYNVRAFPDFLFAFIGTFLPIYVVTYILSLGTNLVAEWLAFGTSR